MVSFRLFAGTNIGLRENNEDNFTVCPDLLKNEWIVPADCQQAIPLGSKGCVMVVADGMGGQNAGEVASAIAIATVQEMFSPQSISTYVLDKPDAIKSYLKKVVSECDIRIKRRTKEDPSTVGMGSTIVLSWLIGNKLYIAWLGDSRAYSFINNKGIARLSKDHSYVQRLVDAGAITDDEAMNHPNSNVITRSLGDTSQRAKPDVMDYDVVDGQIVLLCSDGLCGVCRDEVIGGIIEDSQNNLQECKEKLTSAALAAGGSDNITISLMQIHTTDSNPNAQKNSGKKSRYMDMTTIATSLFGLFLILSLLYAGSSLLRQEATLDKSIKIRLDCNRMKLNETTHYHIVVVGDSLSSLVYDSTLVDVNLVDSTVTVKKTFLKDTAVVIRAQCKHDTSLFDTVRLELINRVEDTAPLGGVEDSEDQTPSTTYVEVENKGDGSGNTGGTERKSVLTLSNGKGQDIVTND